MKAVIFDKDGVLLDMEATWHKGAWVLCQSLAELSHSHTADFFAKMLGVTKHGFDAEYSLFVSGTQGEIYALAQEQVPSLIAPLSDTNVRAEIEQKMFDASQPTPLGDVQSAITALHGAGYRLGVLTNDVTEFTHHCLRQIGVEKFISVVIAADSGYGGKPDPKGLLAACDYLQVTPQETVMVGDSIADLEAAHRAGVAEFIGVSALYPKPTSPLRNVAKIIPNISALPSLFNQA